MSYGGGLFACASDCGICCIGCLRPGYLNAMNWAAVRDESCTCCHWCPCIQVNPFWVRKTLAKQMGEEEANCMHLMQVCCCYPCSVCQDARGIVERNRKVSNMSGPPAALYQGGPTPPPPPPQSYQPPPPQYDVNYPPPGYGQPPPMYPQQAPPPPQPAPAKKGSSSGSSYSSSS